MTATDLGEHYRRLEWSRTAPVTEMPRAVHVSGEAALYQFYGARVQLFVARDTRFVLLVLLTTIGSEHA